MADDKERGRIFISAATDEFGSLRQQLAGSLQRAGFEVEHQDIFPNADADTLRKTANYLRECRLVIHMVGQQPGSVANDAALKDLLDDLPADSLLPGHPELLEELGDFSDITYTQWETFFALHFGVPLLVFAPADAWDEKSESVRDDFPQKDHLARLKLARKYPAWCTDKAEYVGKILPAVIREIGTPVEPITQEISPPKFLNHAAENFLGREAELALLDDAWDTSTELVNVLSMIAWGGVGKTALLAEWIQRRFIAREWQDENGDPELWRYFDWSFYEQGTTSGDDDEEAAANGKIAVRTGSVGDFFERALNFFGDPDPNLPGKGARLARLVQQQRSLLILDGMEPLQQPLNHPQAGQLIDNDLHDLLCALAVKNPGLCVVTSRQPLADLSGMRRGASKEEQLSELPVETAIRLLRNLQITGTDEELAAASEAFGRHALSLTLLGRFLYDAHGGDIRKRDLIDLQDADDATRPDRKRTAWKVLEVYDGWLASATGRPEELAILRLTGLFDRPAKADCLAALRAEPVIPGLTDALVGLSEARWNILLNRLERAHLIVLREEDNGAKGIDAHPLIREYFSKQLRDHQPDAFKTAHSRLFDHLCENTEHHPDTLEGLQPLYQAVVHGCLSNRQKEAFKTVYWDRIQRKKEYFAAKKLKAIHADLACLSNFFEAPWTQLALDLRVRDKFEIFDGVVEYLHMFGRLNEATAAGNALRHTLGRSPNMTNASCAAILLSEVSLSKGSIADAIKFGLEAMNYADKGGSKFSKTISRVVTGIANHFQGHLEKARSLFFEAESSQRERNPERKYLTSIQGSDFCELLLDFARQESVAAKQKKILEEILKRTSNSALGKDNNPLVVSLFMLTEERAKLLLDNQPENAQASIDATTSAISQLKYAASSRFLIRGFLTRATLFFISGEPHRSDADLETAQQIAERGPMPLYLADVHLHRARLFHDQSELTKAAELIHKHEYGRRYEELADAEAAAENW